MIGITCYLQKVCTLNILFYISYVTRKTKIRHCTLGGTDDAHRTTVARSKLPSGPWTPAPNNPVIFNGGYGYRYLTVQSTGHASFVSTPDGRYFMAFLARRNVNGSSPLGMFISGTHTIKNSGLRKTGKGRETFITPVKWVDGWPTVNNPISLISDVPSLPDNSATPPPFIDTFNSTILGKDYYQIRTPYTSNYELTRRVGGLPALKLNPNIYTLSNRDTPAALFRKQKSLNMTFSAKVSLLKNHVPFRSILQEVGVSVYLSEFQHQDIAIKKCPTNVTASALCVHTQLTRNTTIEVWT